MSNDPIEPIEQDDTPEHATWVEMFGRNYPQPY
jgi:hypothetical protein